MDMEKFCDKLLDDENIKDIPISYVFRVVASVLSLIAEGECFYKDTFD